MPAFTPKLFVCTLPFCFAAALSFGPKVFQFLRIPFAYSFKPDQISNCCQVD